MKMAHGITLDNQIVHVVEPRLHFQGSQKSLPHKVDGMAKRALCDGISKYRYLRWYPIDSAATAVASLDRSKSRKRFSSGTRQQANYPRSPQQLDQELRLSEARTPSAVYHPIRHVNAVPNHHRTSKKTQNW